MSKVTWLLVDLDNTLLDFDQSSHVALTQTFIHFGLSDLETALNTYHRINRQCWMAFESGEIDLPTLKKRRFQLFGEIMRIDAPSEVMNRHYLQHLSQQVHEIEGARNFLQWASPQFRLVLATNGLAEVQNPRIKQSQIAAYFKGIVISEEIGVQKPHAAFYDHAFELMDRPSKGEVMMIGDSLSSDIRGGNDYGILTCWFDRSQKGDESLIKPHFTVNHLDQISNLGVLSR
ncbi:MAG: YjjG family noncanonical pyrimidine nucleotidase [Saprospiraceae bacterium]|nr:YjjG family noncanonical pyrimidine nucleotidase [Saprospiraceae bacterium]